MSIDNLFGKKSNNKNISCCTTVPTNNTGNVPEIELEAQKQNTIGRPGKMFRFDEEGYEKMKKNGNFRLEF